MITSKIIVRTCHPLATWFVSIRGTDRGRAWVSQRWPTTVIVLRHTTIRMDRPRLIGKDPRMIVRSDRRNHPFAQALRERERTFRFDVILSVYLSEVFAKVLDFISIIMFRDTVGYILCEEERQRNERTSCYRSRLVSTHWTSSVDH
jgi:hypothetical protein